MKRFLAEVTAVFGGITIIVGIIGIIGGLNADDAQSRLLVLVFMLFTVLIGRGLMWAAYLLSRCMENVKQNPESKTDYRIQEKREEEQHRKQEQKRKEEEKRRKLEQYWKEQDELRKKKRMKKLERWSGICPEDAEHISEWEAAMKGDCKIQKYYL